MGLFTDSFGQWLFQNPTPANLCQANDFQYAVAYSIDSLGNTFYAWQDYRNGKIELFCQKLDAKGKSQWNKDGIKISDIVDKNIFIYTPKFIKPDQNGGAWLGWHRVFDSEKPEKRQLYLQHISKDGNILRTETETLISEKTSISYDPNDGVFEFIRLNNQSFLLIYNIFDSINQSNKVFTQLINQEGEISQKETLLLEANELETKVLFSPISSHFTALIKDKNADYFFQTFGKNHEPLNQPQALHQNEIKGNSRIDYFQTDSFGNTFVGRTFSTNTQKKVFAHKFDSEGKSVWQTDGIEVSSNQTYDIQISPLSDGGGICTWIDTQDKSMPFQLARINSKGGFIWKKAVFTPRSDKDYFLPNKLISDGKDGIYTLWFKPKNIGYDLTVQHFDINGEPLFHEDGVIFENYTFYSDYRLMLHPKGGVVVMWGANQELTDGIGKSVNLYTHYISETGQLGFENAPKIAFQTQTQTTFCPGQQAIINFTVNKTLDLENIYTVYLTDSTATRTKIGSNFSQAMTVQFPKNLTQGKYKLYVTSTSPESDSDTLLITINPLQKPSIASDTNQICAGGKITLRASSCPNGNIRWSNGKLENPQIAQIDKNETFTASCVANGCQSSEVSDSIVIETKMLSVNASNSGPYFQGNLVKLNSNPQSNKSPFTFAWSGPSNFTSSIQNPMILNAQPDADGIYSVKISDSTGCFGIAQTEVVIQQVLANETEAKQLFNIFPNPVREVLSIKIQALSIQNMSLMDSQGHILHNHSINNPSPEYVEKIDVSRLPNGIYYIIIDHEKQKLVQKVIVNN